MHWLEEGMNVVEISVLLGHEQLATTMRYLDISTEDQIKALATLEVENDTKLSPKWKNNVTVQPCDKNQIHIAWELAYEAIGRYL